MTYPDKPAPEGFRVVPRSPRTIRRSRGTSRPTRFTLRSGFRFSDGTPVRASAFARAINRTLARGVDRRARATPGHRGCGRRPGRQNDRGTGVVARGNTLVVRFTRPVADFAAQTTMPFLCAVPPTLPSDPEGVTNLPERGYPYVITDHRPGERVTIRRNPFYGGSRPHHVDGFDVDLRVNGTADALDRVERGEADWGVHFARLLRAGPRTGREVRRQQVALLRAAGLRPAALRLQQRSSPLPKQRARSDEP